MEIPIGEQFERWTIIGTSQRYGYAICQCECGAIKEVYFSNILRGKSKSCGCYKEEKRHDVKNPRFVDLTGIQFGEWNVLYRAPSQKGQTMWHCKCSCGIERDVNARRLKSGESKSCGHKVDLTGERFGHWVLLEKRIKPRKDGHTRTFYICRCDCGSVREVEADTLIRGTSQSCGCVNSQGQQTVSEYLNQWGVEYSTEYMFSDLIGDVEPLRFDFSIMKDGNLLGLVEYQGKQHYIEYPNSQFGKYQREVSDPKKRQYCSEHNIPLFEIRYDEDIESSLITILEALQVNPVPSLNDEEGATTIPLVLERTTEVGAK